MPTALELLDQALAKLRSANRIDGSRNSYRKDSPNEYAAVTAYLAGGGRPLNVITDMGVGLTLAEDARRKLVVVVPPIEPPTEPPPTEPPATGMPNFPKPAFTPSRTVVCTTASQFSSAMGAIQAGDLIDVRGVTVSGQLTVAKNLSNWAEVHFDSGCKFTGTAAGSQLPAIWVHDSSKIRFYGGDITCKGNNGIRFDDTTDITWWDFNVHDCAGTGVLARGLSHALTRLDLRGTITACGYDLSLDPHAEKGTGNHGINIGTGTNQPVMDSRFVLWIKDQAFGAGFEVENTRNSVFYLDARRITFHATQQTGGNAIQFWGSGTQNVKIPYLYADVCEGRAVEMGGLGGGNANIVVEYGRATNIRLSPEFEPNAAITYVDVA